ncbi:exosortase A [Allopontixanthobacter sp.]|uniref:exosortase A n=1 Tax=Allopontixanthobacter sp. TaxID=2906452 RepID=UPI002AB8003E|nr:exosortase A [Allopontixanthobacter sp.]MDZ4308055.1 exosortase A [Allopontixanthobacter sp.]
MSPENTLPRGLLAMQWDRVPASWRVPLVHLVLAWAGLLGLAYRDWLTMAEKWWNISTYSHVLFVPLIIGWLGWTRRGALAQLTPSPWWPGLIALGGAMFLWLLGTIAGVNTASQLGAVAMLPAGVAALLGPRATAALLFPLCFMLFLVPFGDELVPGLQMITARLVIELTQWSGIPAVIDGVFIDTPAGLFEVAEACSGVKFLVAMVALGVLVMHTCFLSWKRRAVFMAAAIALPILANAVRAWGTIYIAQSQGIEFAAGFDHIFYGWIFFALVVLMLLAAAWRWFDRSPDLVGPDVAAIVRSPLLTGLSRLTMHGTGALGGVLGLGLLFAAWAALAAGGEARLPERIALPEVPGWDRVDYTPAAAWEPRASGAQHRLLGRYRNGAGQEVDVFLAVYALQDDGREASASGEGALRPDTPWRWLAPGQGTAEVRADYLLAYGRVKRLAETSYRTGDLTTGSNARLKLATMANRLLLRREPTILAILSAEQAEDQEAAQSIAAFRRDMGDEGEWMDRIAGLR